MTLHSREPRYKQALTLISAEFLPNRLSFSHDRYSKRTPLFVGREVFLNCQQRAKKRFAFRAQHHQANLMVGSPLDFVIKRPTQSRQCNGRHAETDIAQCNVIKSAGQ